jgi:hypothetical protein
MQDILVAIVFLGMVACPAIMSAISLKDSKDEEADGLQVLSVALAKANRTFPAGEAATSVHAR